MKTSRRDFVRLAGAAGTGVFISGISSCTQTAREIKLISPIDGDMLTEIDGIIQEDDLVIPVKISASPGSRISVNGVPAKRVGDNYMAEIILTGYSNTIEIFERKSGYSQKITVYWLKNYLNKYRLSLDDNI